MLLSLSEKIYGLFADSYHRRWDKRGGWRAPVPVISVGNITIGGNGKTPFVIEMVKLLQEIFPELAEPNRIAVLSRGYGRKSKELVVVGTNTDFQKSGDEPLLIKRICPTTLVIANAKRVESAKIATKQFGARLILLDDGFQHRPLTRDLDIVLLDSERPLHNGHLLPRGRLREQSQALARATVFVSVGHGSAVEPLADKFGKPLFHVAETLPEENWHDRPKGKAFLLTGVARPERVRSFVEGAGVDLVGHLKFRDHHAFSRSELRKVSAEAVKTGADVILTTSKDRTRIPSWQGTLPLVEIPYSLALLERESFMKLLQTSVFAPSF